MTTFNLGSGVERVRVCPRVGDSGEHSKEMLQAGDSIWNSGMEWVKVDRDTSLLNAQSMHQTEKT